MDKFLLGLIYGVCLSNIFRIIRFHNMQKKIKNYEIRCRTPQELYQAIKELVRELEDDQEDTKEIKK